MNNPNETTSGQHNDEYRQILLDIQTSQESITWHLTHLITPMILAHLRTGEMDDRSVSEALCLCGALEGLLDAKDSLNEYLASVSEEED
jgi:hypothetical protein